LPEAKVIECDAELFPALTSASIVTYAVPAVFADLPAAAANSAVEAAETVNVPAPPASTSEVARKV
jgi:hypothetical protein